MSGPEGRRGRIEAIWAGASFSDRLFGALLLPAELVFRAGVHLRNARHDRRKHGAGRSRVPVISVGNLSVGGTGKTPFAAYLAATLLERGERPAVLHGGYAYDEPVLHRELNPGADIIVGRDRVRSAELAALRGATVIVLDDGFQHRRLARDLDIVLVAAETWTDRRRLLPRGPWREPAESLGRADVIVVTRKTTTPEEAARVLEDVRRYTSGDTAIAAILPDGWLREGKAVPAPGEAVVVSALARPELFERNAVEAGVVIERSFRFRDHHTYSQSDASTIAGAAGDRPIITTAKDAVKLKRLLPGERLFVLRQRVEIEAGGERLRARLDSIHATMEPTNSPA